MFEGLPEKTTYAELLEFLRRDLRLDLSVDALPGSLTAEGLAPSVLSGAFTALTLIANVNTGAGAYTPSSRLQGDTVRLKGVMVNNTGGNIAAFATWATLPVPMRPAVTIYLPAIVNGGTAIYVQITTAGLLSINIIGGNGGTVFLDGLTFTTK